MSYAATMPKTTLELAKTSARVTDEVKRQKVRSKTNLKSNNLLAGVAIALIIFASNFICGAFLTMCLGSEMRACPQLKEACMYFGALYSILGIGGVWYFASNEGLKPLMAFISGLALLLGTLFSVVI